MKTKLLFPLILLLIPILFIASKSLSTKTVYKYKLVQRCPPQKNLIDDFDLREGFYKEITDLMNGGYKLVGGISIQNGCYTQTLYTSYQVPAQ